jgi:hypothetical protein
LNIRRHLPGELRSVGVKDDSSPASNLGHRLYRLDCADLIVGVVLARQGNSSDGVIVGLRASAVEQDLRWLAVQ